MIGMLWFDASKITLKEKIEKAMKYHQEKYGSLPEACLINKNDTQGVDLQELSKQLKVKVEIDQYVRPNCLLIGKKVAAEKTL